ncbi:MAG: ATP-binding cassette domain-containing protein, partial [Rhodothermales bacterium]
EATRKNELVSAFGLDGESAKPLRHLSGGTRQKVSAVTAFMFEPEMLVLDEPTAGLDPVSAGLLKDLIGEERKRGHTILLTSHIMSEIEELSDMVAFIQDGRIGFSGSAQAIRTRTGAHNLERAIGKLMTAKVA